MIGIYKITSPTGRIYIGQSVDIDYRWNDYRNKNCKSQPRLSRSFLKHGIDNHKFEVIEECSIESLNEKERYYQDLYKCIYDGLNCRLTASDGKSGRMSKESRLKMSEAGKRKVMTAEHKEKIKKGNVRPMLGKKHTAESLALMSENRKKCPIRKGYSLSQETKDKIALKATGRKASEETKAKMSLQRKGVPQSEALKAKRALGACRIILDTQTGVFYIGVKEASFHIGIKYSQLCARLNGETKNNTNLIYV